MIHDRIVHVFACFQQLYVKEVAPAFCSSPKGPPEKSIVCVETTGEDDRNALCKGLMATGGKPIICRPPQIYLCVGEENLSFAGTFSFPPPTLFKMMFLQLIISQLRFQ